MAAESNLWKVLQEQVTEDEFKAFIVYVQELEAENAALKNQIAVFQNSLEETRERVQTLELLVGKREGEIRLHIDENLLLKQQVTEYKFLYENTRPSAFESMVNRVGLGTGIAAVLYFLIQMVD